MSSWKAPPGDPPILPSDEAGLENLALRFAGRDIAACEAEIDALIDGALSHWRLDDATFWQRVKIRARRLRTAPGAAHILCRQPLNVAPNP